ncbi:MAG: universal stress protein [Actinomycetota bacterium]|nr:universal stress protein [Actinomycetota bacterium]
MGEQVLVVGVDGSPASYTALRWTLERATRIGAQVRAVRCWMPIVARRWEAAVTGEPVPPEAEQQARAERELTQVVAAALARIPDGATRVAVRQRVTRGPAGPVLVDESDGADLLVVGHGPRVAELLHRSVSWYCVVHASCPVLVIPPAMATRRTLAPATAQVPTSSPRLSGQSRPQPHGQPASQGIPAA